MRQHFATEKALRLSASQVEQLLEDRTETVRGNTAAGVASEYASGRLRPEERRIAEEILSILAHDTAEQVRGALSSQLQHCPFLPPSIALPLARDVETVSLPMLRFSNALTESQLIELAESSCETKLTAIAGRDGVQAPVAGVVAERGGEDSVIVLLRNLSAEIGENDLLKITERFPEHDRVHKAMVDRPALPSVVVHHLVTLVSDQLREYLVEKHQLPRKIVDSILQQSAERTLVESIGKTKGENYTQLIRDLAGQRELTPTLLLRALCFGELVFFDRCMACMTNLPLETVQSVLYSGGAASHRTLYAQLELPEDLFPAFHAGLTVASEIVNDEDAVWGPETTGQIITRIAGLYDRVSPEGLDEMLSRLDGVLSHGRDTVARQLN